MGLNRQYNSKAIIAILSVAFIIAAIFDGFHVYRLEQLEYENLKLHQSMERLEINNDRLRRILNEHQIPFN